MSTVNKNISASRVVKLTQARTPLFHTEDLGLLFGITNKNTLHVTLHRLTAAAVLHRIQRGLYSILPPAMLDPALLGGACLHRFCYLTTESVLRDEGIILQPPHAVTFASSVSRRFRVMGQSFVCRRLHPRFLHHQKGISLTDGVFRASAERAIADMLYIDPWYHFDHPIDWPKVRELQEEIGYPLTLHRYADSP